MPVIVDRDGQIADAYGLSAFPYWVAVDRDGRVAGRLTGELPVSDIEAIVARLTAE
jgi:thioredoxin-like negative regulator of GroEL